MSKNLVCAFTGAFFYVLPLSSNACALDFEAFDDAFERDKIEVRSNRRRHGEFGVYGRDVYQSVTAIEGNRHFAKRIRQSNASLPTFTREFHQIAVLDGAASKFAVTDATHVRGLTKIVKFVDVNAENLADLGGIDIATISLDVDNDEINVKTKIKID